MTKDDDTHHDHPPLVASGPVKFEQVDGFTPEDVGGPFTRENGWRGVEVERGDQNPTPKFFTLEFAGRAQPAEIAIEQETTIDPSIVWPGSKHYVTCVLLKADFDTAESYGAARARLAADGWREFSWREKDERIEFVSPSEAP